MTDAMTHEPRDIAEISQADQVSALLTAIVDSSDDAIISKDLNGTITSWNKGAERLFGYTAGETVGKSITMLIPADRLEEEPKILSQLKRGERVDHFETIRMRKDGTLLNISLTISPVKDRAGCIVGASKVARDITDRKRIERQRQELNLELERKVAERTAELREDIKKRERLEHQLQQSQKLESMGILAAGIAHDFNNLLNIIQGYASALSPDSGADEINETVAALTETTQRGATLVRQLLVLARKAEVRIEPVEINALINQLSSLLKGSFPKTIETKLELAEEPLTVMADASQITQVIINLCVNARDAMPDGGLLTLKVSAVDGSELAVPNELTADRFVVVEVADTGMGIPADQRTKIFDPFFTTKQVGQGTGLGLAVVYGVVKSHQGFIQVESQLQKGTAFSLFFPKVASAN